MLFEEPFVRRRLAAIAQRASGDGHDFDELQQEGMVHLWAAETKTPGQSISWYLQSCYHHLIDFDRTGRSIDSRRRATQLLSVHIDGASGNSVENALVSREDTFLEVSAKDCAQELERRLDSTSRDILARLRDGWGARAIARALHMSHVAVGKRVSRMRAIAIRLGIKP